MKAVVIYKEQSEHRQAAEDFFAELEKRAKTGTDLSLLDANSKEAQQLMQLYDLMEYPSIVIINPSNGSLVQSWSGVPLPRVDELIYYVR